MTEGLFDLADAIGRVQPGWMFEAACANPASYPDGKFNPDLFFDPWQKDEARAICFACPVRESCRSHVLSRIVDDGVEEAGIWGGTSELQRKRGHVRENPGGRGCPRNLDLEAEILRLAGMGMSESRIAATVGVSSRQVSRVKARARTAA